MVGTTEDHIHRAADIVVLPRPRAWKTWRLEIPNRDEVDVKEAMKIVEEMARAATEYIHYHPRRNADDLDLMMHALEALFAKYRRRLAALRRTY